MPTYADIQMRVRAPLEVEGKAPAFPVEAFWNGAGPWRGTSTFDFEKLDAGNTTPEAYGVALGQSLFNLIVTDAVQRAGLPSGAPCRVRLLLDEEASVPHNVRWERLYVTVGNTYWPLATSPTAAFSRYVAVQMPDTPPADLPTFRVLLAIANPTNLGEAAIDVEKELTALIEEFEAEQVPPRLQIVVLAGVTGIPKALAARIRKLGWAVETGNTSLANVANILELRHCHGFHILCHGEFRAGRGEGLLFLESESDGTAIKTSDTELRAWVKPEIRLALFQACRTAAPAPSGEAPFVGVAHRMVGMGIPAVVAMQDYVSMEDARAFVSGFYRKLLEDGLVDVAANAGRAAIQARGGDWSIPALFLRLQGGQLLLPDPVREAVLQTRRRLAEDGTLPDALPLKVVDHAHGIQYRAGTQPEGPLLSLDTQFESTLQRDPLVFLTGAPGSNKTEQFKRIYCRLADEFLSGRSDYAPVLMLVGNIAQWGKLALEEDRDDSRKPRLLAAIESIGRGERAPEFMNGRLFHFVIPMDEELAPGPLDVAMQALRRLSDQLPNSRYLLVFDHDLLDALRRYQRLAQAKVLVVRPLDLPSIRAYLLRTPSDSDTELASVIESRSLEDIASAPWLLSEMRELRRQGYPFRCRAEVLGLVANRFLATFGSAAIPRCCADVALESMAWNLQQARRRVLGAPTLLDILSDARDGREFQLLDLRECLIACRIISRAGEEHVRFSYPAIQSYFAARWLYQSDDMCCHLEDITATLGRYSRLQHWQDTLVALAGMLESSADCERMLDILLSGSSLGEGSQVHLAARLYAEMRESLGSTAAATLAKSRIVKQIVDTLIWRSQPNIGPPVQGQNGSAQSLVPARPYQDRRRSLEALVSMRHPDALEHLISIAFDPVGAEIDDRDATDVSVDDGQAKRYDVSGTRMVAAAGLLQQPDGTENYFREKRPHLLPLLDAWRNYLITGEDQVLMEIILENDSSRSPVAAFAYAYGGWPIPDDHPLMDAQWDDLLNADVHWSITEMFGRRDAQWVSQHVVEPRLAKRPKSDSRLCYLIQKTGIAPVDSKQRTYLHQAMANRWVVHRALRAFAKLQDPEVSEWLRILCHQILQKDWDAVSASGHLPLKKYPDDRASWSLRHSALEALRDVGDLTSIDVIRDVRIRLEPVLSLLSFQVAEEIYWRATGGLVQESN